MLDSSLYVLYLVPEHITNNYLLSI